MGLAIDQATNIYVADRNNGEVRLMSPMGTNWVVTTIAAGFSAGAPLGVAVDHDGNIYATDTYNSTICEIFLTGTNWTVSTIAGMPGSSGNADGTNSNARFYDPTSIVVDAATNLYVTDLGNSQIRKIARTGTNWVVTTIAGLVGAAGCGWDEFERAFFISLRLGHRHSDESLHWRQSRHCAKSQTRRHQLGHHYASRIGECLWHE